MATSLDSRKGVLKKYPRAETWLAKLDADGAQVRSWVTHDSCLMTHDGLGTTLRKVKADAISCLCFPSVRLSVLLCTGMSLLFASVSNGSKQLARSKAGTHEETARAKTRYNC